MSRNKIGTSAGSFFIHSFFACLFTLALVSCGGGNNIKIKGNLSNATNQKLLLKELTITEAITVDSCIVDNDGDFSLKTQNEKAAFYSLYISKDNNIQLILLPGDKVTISGDLKNLKGSYTVQGSPASMEVKELSDKLDETLKKVDNLRKIYEDSLGSPNIIKVRAMLDSMYNTIEAEHIAYTEAFIRKNLQSLSSLMALYQQLGPRKPVLNPEDHYEFFAMVDSSMKVSFPNADAVQSLHTLMGEVNEKHKHQQEISKRTSIGAPAPEIVLPSYKGDTLRLSSFKGKYVLLDFWASWCNPCRVENPNLVKAFWRYRYAGFDILQVSLDKNRDAWLSAIVTDKLTWNHVSDLMMWKSPVAALYGIESIPSNLLIDKDGVIIAKNLQGEELSNKLKEIFKY